MSVNIFSILVVVCTALAALWRVIPWNAILHWVVTEQRMFQNAMARGLCGIQAGDPLAVWSL
ncbi:MAG: hypothetical protein ACSHXB_10770 [Sulfitobacter sp.]